MVLRKRRPSNPPQRQDFAYEYNGRIIEFSVWATPVGRRISTVVFLGTVQIGKLPLWVAQQCPPGTAVVQGAPHWFARGDGSDIPDFMFRFTREAFAAIYATYDVKALRVIADSQAAPGVLEWRAKNNQPAVIDQLALVQPLGLNASIFTGTGEDRNRLFKERITKNFRYQLRSLLSDRRLLHNHHQIIKTVGYDNPKSNAQYGSGLAYDSVGDLKQTVATGTRVIIICGENDMIFPPNEIKDSLERNKLEIPLVVVPRLPHSPLATRHGMKLLGSAFDSFEAGISS